MPEKSLENLRQQIRLASELPKYERGLRLRELRNYLYDQRREMAFAEEEIEKLARIR